MLLLLEDFYKPWTAPSYIYSDTGKQQKGPSNHVCNSFLLLDLLTPYIPYSEVTRFIQLTGVCVASIKSGSVVAAQAWPLSLPLHRWSTYSVYSMYSISRRELSTLMVNTSESNLDSQMECDEFISGASSVRALIQCEFTML